MHTEYTKANNKSSQNKDDENYNSTKRVKCIFDKPQPGVEFDHHGGSVVTFMADLSDGPGGSFAGKIRRSKRARQIRLVLDERGLTIVIPEKLHHRFTLNQDIEKILDKNLEWILRGLTKYSVRGDLRGKGLKKGEYPVDLPLDFFLAALDETWHIKRIPPEVLRFQRVRCSYELYNHVINLPLEFSNRESLIALRNWLKERASLAFPPMLRQLAAEHGLHVEKIFIKDLKSRWGSCSTLRNVNLSSRLLFLPPDLVRHIMLHELCHMFEMNHSPAFYEHLYAMDPNAEQHIIELKSGWRKIPYWASEPL